MKNDKPNHTYTAEHAGEPPPERRAAHAVERRAECRVADDQRIGEGTETAWSRMAMLERRKRMWREVRRAEFAPSPDEPGEPEGV